MTFFDLTLHVGSLEWVQIGRRPSLLFYASKIAHKTCATPLIYLCILRSMNLCDMSVTWSWPLPELSIKHYSISTFAYCLGVLGASFGQQMIFMRSLRSVTWKPSLLTFGLTWHVTSFGKFRGCFRIVSSRGFERRVDRLYAAIRSRVIRWGV